MSIAYAYDGAHLSHPRFTITPSGDAAGVLLVEEKLSVEWNPTGGDAPTLAGILNGDLSVTGAQDILLAHATDPLQACGDALYPAGYLPSAVGKLKYLRINNLHATAVLTVARKAANGLAIFSAASDGVPVPPGGYFEFYDPTGVTTGVLTTASNDGLTLTPSAGTITGSLLAIFGP